MVTGRIQYDRDTIKAALEQRGLTQARAAREIGVSLRTLQGWLNAGSIPADQITNAVLVLGLPEPDDLPQNMPRTPWLVMEAIERLQETLHQVAKEAAQLRQRVEALERLAGERR